jgi:hypothetical protein
MPAAGVDREIARDAPASTAPRRRDARLQEGSYSGVTPSSAGYSGTPLVTKLGIKPGFRVKVKGAPADYEELLRPLPDDVHISSRLKAPVHVWHLFVRSRAELARHLHRALRETAPGGMIWVSWPKRASGVRTDMTEDVVRELALPIGLVDIKVCAVDETWSGLKLVRRKTARP